MPIVSLTTLLVMFAAAEVGSRILWPEKEYDECRVLTAKDPRQAKPNCTVLAKVPEGPWVTYKMNECGWRTDAPCGPKPSGVLRIATMGASMTMGKNVALNETWGERTGRAISQAVGEPVQIENLGWELLSPLHCYRQLGKVISLRPDLVIYAVNPFDLNRDIDQRQIEHRDDPPATFPALKNDGIPEDRKRHLLQNTLKDIQNLLMASRALTMVQHFLFANPETFSRLYLADGERADYVRSPLTPLWQRRYANFELLLTEMQHRLHAAGIPLLVVTLPARIQVTFLEQKQWPPHTSPYLFDQEMKQICRRANVPFLSTLNSFASTPDGDKLFFIIDTHITGQGNAVIARDITKKLLDGSVVAFNHQSSALRRVAYTRH